MKVFVLVCAPYWNGPLKSVLEVSLCCVGSWELVYWATCQKKRKKCGKGKSGQDRSVCRWCIAWRLSAWEQVGHITSDRIRQVNKCFNTDTKHVGRQWLNPVWLVSDSEPSIIWSLFTVYQKDCNIPPGNSARIPSQGTCRRKEDIQFLQHCSKASQWKIKLQMIPSDDDTCEL